VSSEWGVTALPDGGKSVWASFPTQVAVEEATHAAGAPPEPVPDGSRPGYGFQPLL
jgi:hypothetical protein